MSIRDELARAILDLLEMEERPQPDWAAVGARCDALIDRIQHSPEWRDVPEEWFHYLEDWPVRKKSAPMGSADRCRLRATLP